TLRASYASPRRSTIRRASSSSWPKHCVKSSGSVDTAQAAAPTSSALAVLGENVVSLGRQLVACKAALGVVALRRLSSQGSRFEPIGRSVVVEDGIPPSAAVSE